MADTPYILKRLNGRKVAPIEDKAGAYYYVYTENLSMSTYPSASVVIELPERVNVYGTDGKKRNAYISLGIRGSWKASGNDYTGGIDLGIVCEDNSVWHPAYWDATDKIGHGNDPNESDYIGFTTTPETKKVKVTVTPVNPTKVSMTVAYLTSSGSQIKAKTFNITRFTTARTWDQYYRFGSLVLCITGQDNRQDSTYIVAGKFTQARLNKSSGYTIWGIDPQSTSGPVELAFTYGHPKCQVTTINSDGEVFNIDHWA